MEDDRRPPIGKLEERYKFDVQFDPSSTLDEAEPIEGATDMESAIAAVKRFQKELLAEHGPEGVDGFAIIREKSVVVAHVDRDGSVRIGPPARQRRRMILGTAYRLAHVIDEVRSERIWRARQICHELYGVPIDEIMKPKRKRDGINFPAAFAEPAPRGARLKWAELLGCEHRPELVWIRGDVEFRFWQEEEFNVF